MKKIVWGVLGVVVLVVIISLIVIQNQVPSPQEDNALVVAGTIFPVYDIARIVAGDDVFVKQVLPSGTSPHTFELSPGLLRELQDVDVFYAIGHGIDDWVLTLTNTTGAEVVFLDHDINLRFFSPNDEHGGEDPHYWLDPVNGVVMGRTIAADLSVRLPNFSPDFASRVDKFAEEIVKKDMEWRNRIDTLSKKELVTFHNAFGYFAEHFGLTVAATFEPFPGKEPTPQYLRSLQDSIQADDIRTIFLEPQLATASIKAFASDLDLRLGVLDPLGGRAKRESYADLIEYNVDTIVETL